MWILLQVNYVEVYFIISLTLRLTLWGVARAHVTPPSMTEPQHLHFTLSTYTILPSTTLHDTYTPAGKHINQQEIYNIST